MDYASSKLTNWPDYLRKPPSRQWQAILDGAPLPGWWKLIRQIELGRDDNILDPFPIEGLDNITSIKLKSDICLSGEELNFLGRVNKLGALGWYNLFESLVELSEDEPIEEILDAADRQLSNLPDEKRTIPAEYWQEIREGTTPIPHWWKLVRHIKLREDDNFIDPFPMSVLENITSLDVGYRRFLVPEEVDVIAQLTKLKSLNMSYQEFIVELQPLTNLTKLVSLKLIGCSNLSDLSGLSELTNLQKLDLSCCNQISDLDPLTALKSLAWLKIEECENLSDLTPLIQLTALKFIDLSDCKSITDISPLKKLNQLEFLDFTGCDALTDITPLGNLTNLKELHLGGDSITNLAPVATLTQLESLYIINSHLLTDISPLQELTNLKKLIIEGCNVLTNLSPLTSLTQPTALYLIG